MFTHTIFGIVMLLAATEACPNKCYCSRYKTFCQVANLHSVPRGFPHSTELLRIEKDEIVLLNETTFLDPGLINLKTLQLINIRLSKVERSTFISLKSLESLTISLNDKLTELESKIFCFLYNLHTLDLSNNALSTLKDGVFTDLNQLRHLNLSHNRIQYIHLKMFNGLRSEAVNHSMSPVSKFDLSVNYLLKIDANSFIGLSVFTHLQIEFEDITIPPDPFFGLNRLKSLRTQAGYYCCGMSVRRPHNLIVNITTMKGLSSLLHLNMSHSRIDHIVSRILVNSTTLRSINLSHNRISILENGAFAGLTSLIELKLDFNALPALHDNVFEGLSSLKTLHLEENYINEIQSNVFRNLKNLKFLHIGGNYIHSLSGNVFSELMVLRKLTITSLLEIPEESLAPLRSLKSISIQSETRRLIIKTLILPRLDNLEFYGVIQSMQGFQVMKTLTFNINAMYCAKGRFVYSEKLSARCILLLIPSFKNVY
ncbi:hypothetical protein C0J52_26108 [Blattella germanica]|nr:hypothetical protein C0J52_26108 [Blattella germanica]